MFFTELNNLFGNKLLVTVESVYELSQEELIKLKNAMNDKLKIDSIEINNIINESLIGGLRISYKRKVIDSSIKAKIKDIEKKIFIN